MSARNLFLIKLYKEEDVTYIYNQLYEYMENNKFGIKFEPKNYYDEILNLLDCNKNYFIVTDDKENIECDEIFEDNDAFKYASAFSKREFQTKESEFLFNKLSFLDEIINIIFRNMNVESLEVYVSEQYSISLKDYSEVVDVINHKFVDALLESYNPTKKHNYYGMKTKKFIIKKINV